MDKSKLEEHYFISYSRKDLDIARQLKEDLERHGFKIWMDEYNIIAGTEWEEVIRENIRRSSAVLYLVSPTSRSSQYVAHELELAKIYRRKIIPLWIQGDTEWANVVTFGFFRTHHIDLRKDAYKNGMDKLIQMLGNLSNSVSIFTVYSNDENDSSHLQEAESTINLLPTSQIPDEEREMPEIRNPYKGLHAFEYKDAWSFFGREKLIREIVQQVKNILSAEKSDSQVPRCMMVVGASGSGKSSVVMAGLLPALQDNRDSLGVKHWFFLEPVRPGEDPMNALVQSLKLPFLNKEAAGPSPLARWNRADLRKTLDEPDSRGLNELLRQIPDSPDDRVVLLVDQFEEIFAPPVTPEQRGQFINLLMATATEPSTPILLLFTLRADFYDRILDNETFYEKVEQHLIDIPPMTLEELRSVIEKPAQHPDVNVTFDSYLAEDLLYEVRKRPESLPLLQFTLEQLFEDRDREERRLTRQSYDALGGLQGAINKHAEDIYNYRLRAPEHQAEVRKLFTEHFIYILESYDEPSRLESGEEITRRRVTKEDLHLDDLSVRRKTIEAFVNARLLTATTIVRQSTDLENIPDITYEISHEALINAWERLREWIKEDRKDIYLIQSLRPRIKQWSREENPKKKKELLVEKLALQQLQEYRQRKTLGPLMDEFLQASLAQRRRQKIRKYILFIGLSALVILSLVLGPILGKVVFPPPPDPTIVTSLADSGPGTLPYALQRASDGATITFDANLRGKTIYLVHSGLDINKAITLRGPTGRINISSGNTGNYIGIEPTRNVTIDNMTFTNSYTLKHSILENAGNLTINNSRISGNKSYGVGGAIRNIGNLILNKDTLEKNTVGTVGGAIYNLFGIVSVNNSTISENEAHSNGGGIYSQGGVITVKGSRIANNKADDNAGGGIDIINGSLSMSETHIEQNHSDQTRGGIGGGIAIEGSVAFIATSVITANTAGAKGGGIAVIKDTDNNTSSLVTLQGVIHTDNNNATYYIGKNVIGQNREAGNDEKDIAGEVIPVGTNLRISDDTSVENRGSPPTSYPPQKSPNYLGIADINGFCLGKGYGSGQVSKHAGPDAKDVMFTCFNQSNQDRGPDFSGQAICQFQYEASPGVNTVTDRMANYYDPTSLQCYKNLKSLGSIGQTGFTNYCASRPQYTGLFDDPQDRTTAYDWLCQPKDASQLPTGLSVADACALQYNIPNAIDRLANFNSIDGWECWVAA